jgi:hypothetical protein
VKSPDIGNNTSTLLGVPESSKGSDQAHVSRTCWIIMMLLTRYLLSVVTILAQAFSGAIRVLKALNIFILWVLCRHHICEVHISHFMEELIGEILRPNEESLCPSAEGTAVLFTRWLLKIWNLEREPWL